MGNKESYRHASSELLAIGVFVFLFCGNCGSEKNSAEDYFTESGSEKAVKTVRAEYETDKARKAVC